MHADQRLHRQRPALHAASSDGKLDNSLSPMATFCFCCFMSLKQHLGHGQCRMLCLIALLNKDLLALPWKKKCVAQKWCAPNWGA
ncbi:MAG TPA: hypothetical protein DHV59_19295 [Oxalobacteraceae bacterium]|nr:hypothetical protein [Oxalobacteraceae bacterium]